MPSLVNTGEELQLCRMQATRQEFTWVSIFLLAIANLPWPHQIPNIHPTTWNDAGTRKVFFIPVLKKLVEGLKHIEVILDQGEEGDSICSAVVKSVDNEADNNSTAI